MAEARLIRRVRFRASHHYRRSDWSDEENRRVFGAQTDPHEHDWTVEVHVVGPIDEETGFVTDLAPLDMAIRAVLGGWDGGDLNDLIPGVREGRMLPSTEAIARWLFERLEADLEVPVPVATVRVFESPELGGQYPA